MSSAIFMAVLKGLGKGSLIIGAKVGHRLLNRSIRSGSLTKKIGLYKNNLEIPKNNTKPRKTLITVQRHEAKKAGLHYDFRIRDRRRLLSFVFKKKPPKHWHEKPGKDVTHNYKVNVVRTEDHKVGWDSFEGEIEEGYGAGSVSIDYQSPGILWYKPGRLHIYTPYNKNVWSGHWTFVELTRNNFTAIREAAFPDVWIPRPSYSDVPPENIGAAIKDENRTMVAERKVDGANFILRVNSPGLEIEDIDIREAGNGSPLLSAGEEVVRKIGKLFGKLHVFKVHDKSHDSSYKIAESAEVDVKVDSAKDQALRESFKDFGINIPKDQVPVTISMISRRISSSGYTIHREGNVNHLVFTALPKRFVGKVFRAELWHPDGVTFLSGTLNSGWEKAVLAQRKHGFIKMMVFDYEGSAASSVFIPSPLHYEDRRAFYEDFVRELNRTRYGDARLTHVDSESAGFYSVPDKVYGNLNKINEFYEEVIKEPLPLGEGLVIKDPNEPARIQRWLKMKRVNTYDVKIKEILPGNGKYENAAGKVIVVDKTGTEVAKVGGGFSDEERFDMWNHPNKYIGRVIEVKAQDLGKEALRAPRMIRWRDDKGPDDIDIVPVTSHQEIIKNYLRGAGLTEKQVEDAYFAVKVSAGWRPKR